MLALADTLDDKVQSNVGEMVQEIDLLNRLIVDMKEAATHVKGQSVSATAAANGSICRRGSTRAGSLWKSSSGRVE